MRGRVPALVIGEGVPESAVEIVLHEPELFGRVLGDGVERAVVGYYGFEFAAEGLALDPVGHVAAVGGAKGHGAVGVDVGEVLNDVVKAENEVFVRSSAPLVLNAVDVGLAEACAAGWVGCNNNVALFGIDGLS